MAGSDRISPVVEYFVTLLRSRQVEHEIADVWYGDQQNIPRTPAIAVEPGTFTRDLSGIGGKGRTTNTIRVNFLVYINNIKDVQQTRKDADLLAEKVMDILHEDVTAGGLVIHGFVTSLEPGYSVRNNNIMRSARLTWEGQAKTLI